MMPTSAKAEWRVVSTHFGKLEGALNDLSADGFSVWKLIVLSPESTRTKRFVVIVIGQRAQALENAAEPAKIKNQEFDAGDIYFLDANNLDIQKQSADQIDKRYAKSIETRPIVDPKPVSVKKWEGMLRDPAGRSTRRTGRFEVREDV